MQYRNYKTLLLAAVVAWIMLLAGCSGGGSSSGVVNGVQYTVNTPARIAQESADDYNSNVNGLITGATLQSWISNWTQNRPSGITGKLVILQIAAGPAGSDYIKSDGVNVFTYLTPTSDWIETRSDGVMSIKSMVPDGATMDALLQQYNIDPTKDMIVAAMGTGSTGNAMGQGRIWYALRYWGVDKTHLALLNGGNGWLNGNGMTAADFQSTPDTAPGTGTFSVKSLLDDNTQLQATLEDMLKIMPSSDTKPKGVFIWDARNMAQYSAGQMVEMGGDVDSDTAGKQACTEAYCASLDPNNYMWTFQNGDSRQGHPWGALELDFTNLLDASQGYSYKPKAELAAYLTGATDANGIGFVNGNYQLVGQGNAYQPGDVVYTYCETTFRAMITGITSAVILGKPTRFYDGAMLEWNSLSYLMNKDGTYNLPSDSPWRTDVKSYFQPATSSSAITAPTITNAYALTGNAIVEEDEAYKTGQSVSTGSSGSSSGGAPLPTNPCGG